MSVEKNIRIQNLYDDQAKWEAVYESELAVPRRGEIVIYDDNGIQKIKIGDGNTPLKDLQYAADMYHVLYGYSSDEIFKYSSDDVNIPTPLPSYKCLLIQKEVTKLDSTKLSKFKDVESVQFEKGINLESIPANAFKDYSNLKSISIPTTVTNIDKDGDGAILKGCNNLEYIEVPFTGKEPYGYFEDVDGNADINNKAIFGKLFGASLSSEQDSFIPSSLKTIKITNAKHIHARTFEKCRHVETIEITLNNDDATIEPGLFRDCNSLTHIRVDGSPHYEVKNNCIMKGTELIAGCNSSNIPDGTTTICYEAFRGAIHLLRAELPATVTTLESAVFKNCHSLNSVTQGDGDGSLTVSPSYECFLECRSLYSIDLNCARIGYNAFGYCSTLSSISISNACKTVDPYAFQYCTALTELTIPDSVYRKPTGDEVVGGIAPETEYCCIGTYAFNGCNSLTHLTIPEIARFDLGKNDEDENILINYIPSSVLGQMFGGSYDTANGIHPNDKVPASLKTVTLTKQKSLPADCFKNCYYIETVETSGDITSYGEYTFYNCRHLVNIPNITSLTTNPKGMFYGCSELRYFTIPSGVTKIGDETFSGCTGLTSVTIPSNVTSIGNSAFKGCTELSSITIPANVTSIGKSALAGCTGLESITLPFVGGDGNTHFGYIFGADSYSDNYDYIPTSLKTMMITGNTSGTNIGSYAFAYCRSLTSVTIGSDVKSIGTYAFQYCNNLTSVTIGSESISTSAFSGCSSLTSVTIGRGVKSIGDYAFSRCTSLTSVAVHNGVTSIGEGAFSGCTGLTSITLPFVGETKDGTTPNTHFGYIFGADASSDNMNYVPSSLKTVVITGNTSIGSFAFYRCSSLTSVTIGSDVKSIGTYAFQYCNNLTSVIIPDSVTSIGGSAFYSCNSLESITLPFVGKSLTAEGHESIFGYIFGFTSFTTSPSEYHYYDGTKYYTYYVPKSLKTVVITGGTSIGEYAFAYCDSLTSVTIPNSVTSIGKCAFAYCRSLTSVIIPDSVTSISERAFVSCGRLTTVTIGSGVTRIYDLAFFECQRLIEVYNCSKLDITTSSTSHGSVGANAKNVYTPNVGKSKLVTIGDLILYDDNQSFTIVGYTSNSTNKVL